MRQREELKVGMWYSCGNDVRCPADCLFLVGLAWKEGGTDFDRTTA